MRNILFTAVLILLFGGCYWQETDIERDFRRFKNSFSTTSLPLDTNVLYRVHNSDVVSARIDTAMVQAFIDAGYKLAINDPVYDGYGYGLRLPKEEDLDYEGLIFYESKGREQFFVLNTYTPSGELVSSLPISGDSSSYKRITGRITQSRLIGLREFVLHYPELGSIEYFYQINKTGLIEPLDTFYTR